MEGGKTGVGGLETQTTMCKIKTNKDTLHRKGKYTVMLHYLLAIRI